MKYRPLQQGAVNRGRAEPFGVEDGGGGWMLTTSKTPESSNAGGRRLGCQPLGLEEEEAGARAGLKSVGALGGRDSVGDDDAGESRLCRWRGLRGLCPTRVSSDPSSHGTLSRHDAHPSKKHSVYSEARQAQSFPAVRGALSTSLGGRLSLIWGKSWGRHSPAVAAAR
jgi:hypothetical protein